METGRKYCGRAFFSLAWRSALTLNTGEFPNEQTHLPCRRFCRWGVPEKYYLSQKACLGILKKSIPLVAKELPATCDSTGATGTICLNDQGGELMDVTTDITCTLRAKSNHPPCASWTLQFLIITERIHVYWTDRCCSYDFSDLWNGEQQPTICCGESKTYDVRFTSEGTVNARSNVYESDTARTIDTSGNTPDSNQGGIAVVESMVYKVL